jgi:hypothetical protein
MKPYNDFTTTDLILEFAQLIEYNIPVPVDLEANLIDRGIDTSRLRREITGRVYIDDRGVVHSSNPRI